MQHGEPPVLSTSAQQHGRESRDRNGRRWLRDGRCRGLCGGALAVLLGYDQQVIEIDRSVSVGIADGAGGAARDPVVLGNVEQVAEVDLPIEVEVPRSER